MPEETRLLSLEYRPQTIKDITGQPAVAGLLWRAIHEASPLGVTPRKVPAVPSALLFAGTRGSGKTSTARILAKALNCEDPRERPCDACASCDAIREGTSLAVVEIDAASNGTVEQVHRLQELLSFSVLSRYRVVILDEAHSLSAAGFEALLKTLEEPPENTVFVLCTTERSKIKDTIGSRCQFWPFRRVAPAAIQARLQHIKEREEILAEPALLALLAERADGSLRDGVMLLDQARRAGITTRLGFEQLHGETDFAPWLVAYMITGKHAELFAGLDRVLSEVGDYRLIHSKLVSVLRDVLVLHSGGALTAEGAALRHREQIRSRATVQQCAAVMKVLWDLRTRAGGIDRSSLELAMVMGAQVFQPKDKPAAPAPVNGSANGGSHGAASTLGELKALVAG